MKTIILLTILSLSITAKAQSLDAETKKAISKAAAKYKVSELDLLKIAFVESTLRKAPPMRTNKNGTFDVGMFQINSVHWYSTCKGMNVLKIDGNAMCAAKLLASHLKHSKTDTNWLGRYHSKTPKYKKRYAKKLSQAETYIVNVPNLYVAKN